MIESDMMKTFRKKPLSRSIALGCILFMVILCLALGVLNYVNQKTVLYQRYEAYITDLLHMLETQIDAEDMKQCIETGVESPTYQKTLQFMDGIMNTYSIHYLYMDKPLNLNATGNVMCVFSAENDYNRYTDTKGNLYLGWVSQDEFELEIVKKYFEIMEHGKGEVDFFVSETAWGYDYTGAIPVKDAAGESYAILAVDVDISEIHAELQSLILRNFIVIFALGLLFTMAFLAWLRHNVTEPIRKLESGVVDYANRSHGQRDVEALKFEAPPLAIENEVKSLSNAIVQMTENMQGYVSEMLSAEAKSQSMQELADQMSELAVADKLTGVRNKNAFTLELQKLEAELAVDRTIHFAMGMVDLNYLKWLNDNYGHEKGDDALFRLARLLCATFAHSQIFRIGGDEFALLIRAYDYQHIDKLKERFLSQITANPLGEAEPWTHVSAAIGIAVYDSDADGSTEDVLKRADQSMYEMKKEMKAFRTESVPKGHGDGNAEHASRRGN